jgi:hypothetical protein
MQRVRACALEGAVLFCTDGLRSYKRAIQQVFRTRVPQPGLGRPHLRVWANLCFVQIVKYNPFQPERGMLCRLRLGVGTQVSALLRQSQGEGVANTAYLERLNATFRAHLSGLVRRGRCLLRQQTTLHAGIFLMGTVYNFCTPHDSLRLPTSGTSRKWFLRTPAMAAGLTEQCWTVHELLLYRVPLAHWTPPKRRGRPSKFRVRRGA